jgi:hypothetical protein
MLRLFISHSSFNNDKAVEVRNCSRRTVGTTSFSISIPNAERVDPVLEGFLAEGRPWHLDRSSTNIRGIVNAAPADRL